jgi:hypothetical protein
LVNIASKKPPHLVQHSLNRCATTSLNYDDSCDQTACIRSYINLIPVTKTPVLDTSCCSTPTVNGRFSRISASYRICEILDLNFCLGILPGISDSCYNLQASTRIVGLPKLENDIFLPYDLQLMDLPTILLLLALVMQLPKKFPRFYGTRSSFTAFTTARHW